MSVFPDKQVEQKEAECLDCPSKWSGRQAIYKARDHHRDTDHHVRAKEGRRYEWGIEE